MAAKNTVKKKTAKKKTSSRKASAGWKTLAFDIGGSGLKASLLDERGKMITERARVDTPKPCPPTLLLKKLKELTAQLPPFDRVSVGFPGPVRKGRTLSSANLGSDEWNGFDLRRAIAKQTGKPTAVINDADMQGLGAIKGEGVEMVITLGTGLGASLVLALLAGTTRMLTRDWQMIGVRILGSWIVASAVLVLALHLARGQLF